MFLHVFCIFHACIHDVACQANICVASCAIKGYEESMPELAWQQLKATLDESLPIVHNRPQNQFEPSVWCHDTSD